MDSGFVFLAKLTLSQEGAVQWSHWSFLNWVSNSVTLLKLRVGVPHIGTVS